RHQSNRVPGFDFHYRCALPGGFGAHPCRLSQRPCSCPPSWIGFEGKCFYFSDGEKNQTLSRADCHARNASLAVIQSREELVRLGLLSCFILGGGQSSGGDGEPPFQPCSHSAPRTS
uniref:C-type lectin domain-containing protein n=1 Tax=Anas platyrhynchos TaxID=8839 RepID=A0A8B9T2R3_ANAPL